MTTVKKMNRRQFLEVAGVGAAGAAAVAAVAPLSTLVLSLTRNHLHFRAVAGMPGAPLPAYASYVLEGKINMSVKSGTLTSKVFAGAPEAMSAIEWPGLGRTIQVTEVAKSGGVIRVTGVADSSARLLQGESPTVQMVIDPSQGRAWGDFFGTKVSMRLVEAAR